MKTDHKGGGLYRCCGRNEVRRNYGGYFLRPCFTLPGDLDIKDQGHHTEEAPQRTSEDPP